APTLISSSSNKGEAMTRVAQFEARTKVPPIAVAGGQAISRLAMIMGVVILAITAAAQNTSSTPVEGMESGNYNYQGSIEMGYRFVDNHGNGSVYNTFVNQQQGPRILEQTLNMR